VKLLVFVGNAYYVTHNYFDITVSIKNTGISSRRQ